MYHVPCMKRIIIDLNWPCLFLLVGKKEGMLRVS